MADGIPRLSRAEAESCGEQVERMNGTLNGILFGMPIPAGSVSQRRHARCGCAVEEPKRPDGTCEGCRHLGWEHDMGTSRPICVLGAEPGRGCSFAPHELYLASKRIENSSD